MAYVPFAPEIGAKYTLTAGDGTVATFNDASDPNYVGILQDVTGLDSPDVRESGDILVQTDGGWHGNFYYGRRPITLNGTVVSPTDAADRARKLDLLRYVSNAMRADAILSWTNNAAGSVAMQTWVRRQQPLRITGAWTKTFQLLLVSQYAPLFSVAQHNDGSNALASGSGLTSNTAGLWTNSGAPLTAGATLTGVTTPTPFTGTGELKIVTTASANEGAVYALTGTFRAGVTYTFSVYLRGNSGGEVTNLLFGSAGTGADRASVTNAGLSSGGWTQYSVQWTPSSARTDAVAAIRNQGANAITFFANAAQVNQSTAVDSFVVPGNVGVENKGSALAYPLITIYGPTSGTVSVTSSTTGQVFQALAGLTLTSGQYVQVDMLNHTAVRNDGTNLAQYIDFVNSSWPALIGGSPSAAGNNTLTLTNAAWMVVTWRDQWI
jgi:hypothetical protein